MNILYHFYFDEGGIFGHATYGVEIVKTRITKNTNSESLLHYYIGKMSKLTIHRYIQLFHKAFPKCLIVPSSDTIQEFQDIKEILTEYGM